MFLNAAWAVNACYELYCIAVYTAFFFFMCYGMFATGQHMQQQALLLDE